MTHRRTPSSKLIACSRRWQHSDLPHRSAPVGTPGDSSQRRYALSRERLAQAVEGSHCSLRWFDRVTGILIPNEDEPWQSHWRSAMWVGVAATSKGILLKPYFNLNRGSAR